MCDRIDPRRFLTSPSMQGGRYRLSAVAHSRNRFILSCSGLGCREQISRYSSGKPPPGDGPLLLIYRYGSDAPSIPLVSRGPGFGARGGGRLSAMGSFCP